ncbi:ImmA/IrrE family metallo-endopeptidase [Mameliella alba]|nr:ImmA/IrrE family metallo-endopeptidase [Mameliella alba]MBY6171687.1 ImmA/IrrE family metallo-endopeptidase [Mameliella alba]MBY6176912.1 ImmA/IrrE family metallo-endopeptidase [Mameliella alba]
MKKSICVGIIVIASLAQPASSECVLIPDAQGIGTPHLVEDSAPVLIEPAFEDYMFMLFDACEAAGLSLENGCDIYPMMGDISAGAVAALCEGNKVIVYNRRLSREIGYAGAQAALAHELGHHACGHFRQPTNSVRDQQLREAEADAFAGAVMRKLGFSAEAALGYQSVLGQGATHSHPSKLTRLGVISAGWLQPDEAFKCNRVDRMLSEE